MIETVGDLWAIERSNIHRGLYHVLGGHLSALDGIGPDQLQINSLLNRLMPPVSEIILALNGTVDGQTTAHYLSNLIAKNGIEVTRLAYGIPVGGEIHYLDDGTLTMAFKLRRNSER